jgi:aldehyde dehydrogenase (NAD+)
MDSKNNQWDYDVALENISHINIKSSYDLYINGAFVKPRSGNYFDSINPSTGEKIAQFAYANETDVDHAVQAAQTAFLTWSKLSGKERGKYIFRIARMMQERARELAIAECIDTGKPIREAKDVDIPLACNHFFYYAGWADKLEYVAPMKKVSSIGVVGQIVPWNFPLLMAAWKIAPALAAGNTVVLKSAETTPLTAYLLAEIIKDAGLPEGVVNIISGDGVTGAALVQHELVKKIAFTGSTEVGKLIQKMIAGTGKKVTLELGGKSANIIFEDAAINEAVEGVVNGIFFNQGHVCCAGSRLYIQESIFETFIQKLKFRIDQLIVGNPLDKNTDIGAINSKEQWERINAFIQEGIAEGNEVYQSPASKPEKGFYCVPTLFINVAQSNRLNQEEIFGPVLTIQSFRTTDEVIQKANNSPYGLAAGVWTERGAKLFNLASKLKAGVVWGNTYNKFDPSSPFGGFKESGIGREGGMHGLLPYLNLN